MVATSIGDAVINEDFYLSFEDKYRGNQELIKSRLEIYLPFISLLLKAKEASRTSALDLGCGRGEWLELLNEQGVVARGVDVDKGMLQYCHQKGLLVEDIDALAYLQSLKDKSITVISGFHIAEHLPFVKLQEIVEHSLRVLEPGGLLILETPNPENIVVGTANFYLDPTHERPLPPQLLSFIAEYAGFERVKVLRLQETKGLVESQNLSLINVLSGVSPDYSIVAQKHAAKKTLKSFDELFSKEYGVTLYDLANLYEEQLTGKFDFLKSNGDKERRQNESLVADLGTAREQKAAAEAVLEQLTLRIQGQVKRLDEFNNEKDKLNKEKDELKEQNESLVADLGTAREEKAAAEAVLEQLTLRIQGQDKRLDEFNKEKDELKEQNEGLIAQLGAAREEKAAAEAVLEQLTLRIQGQDKRLDEFNKEKDELKEQNEGLMAELGAAREQKTAAEAVLEQLTLRIQGQDKHLDELNKEKDKLKEHNEGLLAELGEAREQKTAAEAVLEQLTLRIQGQDKHLDELNKEKDELKEQYEELQTHSKRLQGNLDISNEKVDELHQSNHQWWLISEERGKELEEAKIKIDQLHQSNHQWWTLADRSSKELQNVYESNSWVITWPLRKFMQLIKWLIVLPKRLVLWIVRLPKRTLRWLVIKAMAFALKRPGLKNKAIVWLRQYPSLGIRLRRLAQARGLVASQATISSNSPHLDSGTTEPMIGDESFTCGEDFSHLSLRAQRIYTELKVALEKNYKENG